MKKKTKIILFIIAILVILCIAAIVFMVTSDLKQEEKLGKELDSLYALLSNYPLDYESLDKQLSTTITTDDYAKVEKAIKDYSKEFVNYMKQFDTLINDDTIINAVSIENIKEDGPDFKNTKKKLSESKTSVDTILTNFSDYLTEEVALSYIKDIELDEYYTDIYKQYVLGDNLSEMESARDEIVKSLKDVKTLIENEEETVNFLVKNKKSWKIENNQLVFSSESLINQYNDIVVKIKEIE